MLASVLLAPEQRRAKDRPPRQPPLQAAAQVAPSLQVRRCQVLAPPFRPPSRRPCRRQSPRPAPHPPRRRHLRSAGPPLVSSAADRPGRRGPRPVRPPASSPPAGPARSPGPPCPLGQDRRGGQLGVDHGAIRPWASGRMGRPRSGGGCRRPRGAVHSRGSGRSVGPSVRLHEQAEPRVVTDDGIRTKGILPAWKKECRLCRLYG